MTTSTRSRPAQPVEQRARGDGLDGFAQAHFVGQQRALGESEMQHALALVGKERHAGFVRRPFAALHFQFIFAAQFLAFGATPALFEPRANFLREPQFRQVCRAQFFQVPPTRHPLARRSSVRHQQTIPHRCRQPRQSALDAQRVRRGIRHDIHARRTVPDRLREKRLNRASRWSSTASTCLQVPRPFLRKSWQAQANCRPATSRISTA